MRIGILSFQPIGKKPTYEEIRMKNEAKLLGFKPRIFRAAKCQLVYGLDIPQVFYDNRPFPHSDVIIPRVRLLTEVDVRVSVMKHLQLMGIPMFNDYLAVTRAKNKLRTLQILDHEGISIPRTVAVEGFRYLDDAIKRVGGLPVILKLTTGSYGSGVIIAESKRALKSAFDAVVSNSSYNIVLIQEYIKEAKGSDTRVFVVSNKIIGAMKRQAKRGEFRSNLELGGKADSVALTSEEALIALGAAQALKLEVAGVDIIATKNGPAVMEVNANPGFEGLEEATGVNVAKAIVEAAICFSQKEKRTKK